MRPYATPAGARDVVKANPQTPIPTLRGLLKNPRPVILSAAKNLFTLDNQPLQTLRSAQGDNTTDFFNNP
jgi:hypothetical protein